MNNFTPETSIEDVTSDPKKYGAPTFEEFKRNLDRWRKKREHAFIQIDNGASGPITAYIQKTKYFFDNGVKRYEAKTLEKAQQIAHDEGVQDEDLEWTAELIPLTGYKANVHVVLKRKPVILK